MASVLFFPVSAHAQAKNESYAYTKNVRSLKEIRGEGVVRQRWDMSCGAAALSTLLTYEFRDNTPETAIVVWILHRVDPVKVRARGGFSLLDMKRFAEARGYHAQGYSGMSIKELATQKTAVIVPIRLKGFDHFIVVNRIVAGRVIVADPGFGNITMRVDRFQSLWKQGIAFVVRPPSELMITEKRPSVASLTIPDTTIIQREIGVAIPPNYLY
jgi:hypothetical protein